MGGLSGLASLADTGITGNYYRKVLYYRPIAYWPLWETAGATARCLVNPLQNGTYTGVTLANAAGSDGNPTPWFDGANDYVNVLTAALIAAFNGSEGTMMLWGKVNAGAVWADGVLRRAMHVLINASNVVNIWKAIAANTAVVNYIAGGTTESVSISTSSTAWQHYAITWSKSADQVKAYLNGSQSGATQTVLGNWAAGALTIALIGANTTVPANVWHGWLAHCALWSSALAPAAILDLATV